MPVADYFLLYGTKKVRAVLQIGKKMINFEL